MKSYFDHNASTPVDPRVLDRFVEVERTCPGNPGSLHRAGRRARAALEHARQDIADALAVSPDAVVFTSGGTEANNIAVHGLGTPELPVLLAPVEHPSVLQAAERRGAAWWNVAASGHVEVVRPEIDVGMMCLVHAQNELGTLQPVAAARDLAQELGVPLHVDISQSLGRAPVATVVEAASTVAISAHKAGGLRGSSVLVAKHPDELRPLLFGGGQERGLRPGTPSPALAAATARAIQLAMREQEQRAAAMRDAMSAFEAALDPRLRRRRLTVPPALPNTVMYLFDDVDGRNLLPAFDLAGVSASQGSACSTGAPEPPRVLSAIGLEDDDARRCVRFSCDWRTAPDDAQRAGAIVSEVVLRLQAV